MGDESLKYTDWYPPEVKPVHKGLYECQCCYLKFWWDGATWWTANKKWKSFNQKITWRGLKSIPKGEGK